jgi:hypothetical protein
MLAMMGSTFAGARRDDLGKYQILIFFIGPSNLGKSELKRIMMEVFGRKMHFQPDISIWGRPFSAGHASFFLYSYDSYYLNVRVFHIFFDSPQSEKFL